MNRITIRDVYDTTDPKETIMSTNDTEIKLCIVDGIVHIMCTGALLNFETSGHFEIVINTK